MQINQNNEKKGQQDDQPESVLNIIRKEFFDLGGHDKDDELKSSCIHSLSFVLESPFYGLTKSVVLQECRCFHDQKVVSNSPDLCALRMAKVLYLLVVEGESFTSDEISNVFFGATKLFQSQDVLSFC